MEFLNRSVFQITDLFRNMSIGARITSALLLAVVVVSLAFLVQFRWRGEEYLFGGREFSQAELEAMQAAFAKAGLQPGTVDGRRIRIPRAEATAYLVALADDQALPRDIESIIDDALNGGSWWDSRHLRDLRYRHARQRQVAMTISRFQGISEATVQYDEVETGGLSRALEKSAVVAVRAHGLRELTQEQIRTIRHHVSSAFAGLSPDNVTVTDLNADRAYTGTELSADISENIYGATKRMFEQQWRDKVYDLLGMYQGVVVGVNVDLDPQMNEETVKVTYDPQGTPVETETMRRTREAGSPDTGGRVGAVPNQVPGNRAIALTASTTPTSSEEDRESRRSITGHEQTVRQKASLVPTWVKVTVQVPRSHLVRLYREANPPADRSAPDPVPPAEIARLESEATRQITDAVNGILPEVDVAAGQNSPRVTVTIFDDVSPELNELPSTMSSVMGWLQLNWQTLGMFFMVIVSLVMLRGLVKAPRTSPGDEATEAVRASGTETAETPAPSPDTEEKLPPKKAIRRLRRKPGAGGPNLKEELADLVRDDPDAAANVLRTWIGDAA